jgi:hypothetical protein
VVVRAACVEPQVVDFVFPAFAVGRNGLIQPLAGGGKDVCVRLVLGAAADVMPV